LAIHDGRRVAQAARRFITRHPICSSVRFAFIGPAAAVAPDLVAGAVVRWYALHARPRTMVIAIV
jgi:hypothetical protein